MTIITDCSKAEQMLQEILQRIEYLSCESQALNIADLIDLMTKVDQKKAQNIARNSINIARQRFLNGEIRPLYVYNAETKRPERVRPDFNPSSN